MINLTDYNEHISSFLNAGIHRFEQQHGNPLTVGIYCCPWSGWITLNFNTAASKHVEAKNCPDFEFVEFELLDLQEWGNEYEKDEPRFAGYEGAELNLLHENEALNKFVFDYLMRLLTEIKLSYKGNILVQMLDSECKTSLDFN